MTTSSIGPEDVVSEANRPRRHRGSVRDETERTRKQLQVLLAGSPFTQREVARRCGWSESRLSRLVNGPTLPRVADLLTVLGAIHVTPRDFFHRLYG